MQVFQMCLFVIQFKIKMFNVEFIVFEISIL